jgi:4-carboxymuconolactone decarboxylase
MSINFKRFGSYTILAVIFLTLGVAIGQQVPKYYTLDWPVTQEEYAASLPDDVYPDSGSRLPFVNRDELDDEGKAFYDSRRRPGSTSLGGIRGPGSVRLHGSPGGHRNSDVDKRTQELVRLVVSREMDQPFEWTLHEPVALRAGLEPEIIDVIRYRRPLDGVPEVEASLIQWGRELFQTHSVSSETFARVLRNVGKRKVIDISGYMGDYTSTAILLHTIDAHLPYDQEPLLPLL